MKIMMMMVMMMMMMMILGTIYRHHFELIPLTLSKAN